MAKHKPRLSYVFRNLCGMHRASQVSLVVENPPVNAGDIRDAGSIPDLGRFPGGRHGNPLQYSLLENPMNRGTWQATIYGVTKELDTTKHKQEKLVHEKG